MKKVLMITILLLAIFSSVVSADSEAAPYSYKSEAANGKYVFVMLAEDSEPIFSSTGEQYKASGLYLNDGSISPLWTIDWYAYQVFMSQDGEHIIRMGPWPMLDSFGTADASQLAVSFYEKGQIIKEYSIANLITNPQRLQKSVSHFEWRNNVSFDEKTDKLTIETKEGKTFVLNKFGELVSGRVTTPIEKTASQYLYVFIIAGVCIGTITAYKFLKGRHKEK